LLALLSVFCRHVAGPLQALCRVFAGTLQHVEGVAAEHWPSHSIQPVVRNSQHETLNFDAAREMAIGSVWLAILIMASVVTQAVTLPTAALAGEAGPPGGKVSALRYAAPRASRISLQLSGPYHCAKVCMSLRLYRLLLAFGFVLVN
jgi:hypothetical protein